MYPNVGLKLTNDEYATKQKGNNCAEKVLMHLAWDVKELSDLVECGRKIIVECGSLDDKLSDAEYDEIGDNFPQKISSLCESVCTFVKQVTKYKRTAATHILVVMISPEERDVKPYAMPIQCLAYKSLKDDEVRQICNSIIEEMLARKMKVAGT